MYDFTAYNFLSHFIYLNYYFFKIEIQFYMCVLLSYLLNSTELCLLHFEVETFGSNVKMFPFFFWRKIFFFFPINTHVAP